MWLSSELAASPNLRPCGSHMHQVRWRRVLCSVPYLTFGHELWVAAGLLQVSGSPLEMSWGCGVQLWGDQRANPGHAGGTVSLGWCMERLCSALILLPVKLWIKPPPWFNHARLLPNKGLSKAAAVSCCTRQESVRFFYVKIGPCSWIPGCVLILSLSHGYFVCIVFVFGDPVT